VSSLFSSVIDAELVTLAWERGDNRQKGFRIYYGEQSEVYDNHIEVGNVTRVTVDIPLEPAYIAATAFNHEGLESEYSNEIYFEEVTAQYTGATSLIVSQYCDGQTQPPETETLQMGKDYELQTLPNGSRLYMFNRSFIAGDRLSARQK
jgi:hypothetical protein